MKTFYCIGCLAYSTDNASPDIYYLVRNEQAGGAIRPDELIKHYTVTLDGLGDAEPGGTYRGSNGEELGVIAQTMHDGAPLCLPHARTSLYHRQQNNPRPRRAPEPAWRPW